MPSDAEHPFMCLWAQYVLLGEISVQDLCPLFNWMFVFLVLSWMSSLYILEIKPLSEVLLANMFSHTVGSVFILMLFSLAVQKLFILMRSHLFILSFMSLALGDISVKPMEQNREPRNKLKSQLIWSINI